MGWPEFWANWPPLTGIIWAGKLCDVMILFPLVGTYRTGLILKSSNNLFRLNLHAPMALVHTVVFLCRMASPGPRVAVSVVLDVVVVVGAVG